VYGFCSGDPVASVNVVEQTLDNIGCHNVRFAEQRLAEYLRDPDSVTRSWRQSLRELDGREATAALARPSRRRSVFNPVIPSQPRGRPDFDSAILQDRVEQLVCAFRLRGHLAAKLDPLGMSRPQPPELSPESHGFNESDLQCCCSTLAVGGPDRQTLETIVRRLRDTYCRYIGVQFMHIDDPAVRQWLQQRMESSGNRIELSRQDQLRILTHLTDAVVFEQ
jgi:2-oxoglutarate dehydrogenase E1 component